MQIFLHGFVIIVWVVSSSSGHTHDEIPKCKLTGVYKTRQTTLESPNYPNNYSPDMCWDYVIRSPYRCPTKFHIQFLDFYLETSKDCKNDYLAVGLDNVDDDMDILCGQVVGIKKYHTPDGVLRLRFYADESSWSTGKGFKLLITRLACEREQVFRELVDDDDTVTVTAPAGQLRPPQTQIMDLFRNLTGREQHQVYPLPPLFGLNYPTQLPTPPYPGFGGLYLPSGPVVVPQQNYLGNTQNNLEKPCNDKTQTSGQTAYYPPYVASNNNYLPVSQDQYVGSWPATSYLRAIDGSGSTASTVEACCTSAFQQKRMYLSSPGFPRTIFSNLLATERRDCEFHLQKNSANVCRLRVEFKFFDFGQNFQGTGSLAGNIGLPAISSSKNTCTDDYIEIDNQRFCGCRSDHVYTAFWNYQGDKKIRMRMGYSGVPSGGFLLELVQEECSETQFSSSTMRPTRPLSATTQIPPQNQGQSLGQLQQQHPGLSQQNFGGQFQPFGQNPTQQPNSLLGNYQTSQGQLNPQQQGLSPQHDSSQQLFGGQWQNFGQNPLQQSNSLLGNYQSSHGQFNQPHPGLTQQQDLSQQHYGGQLQHYGQNPTYLGQQQMFNTQGLTSSLQQSPFLPQHIPQQGISVYQPIPQLSGSYPGYQYNSPNALQTNPYGLPQLRYARSYSDQQPVSIVETNSTRKEYYFSDNEEDSFNEDPSLSIAMSRSSKASSETSRWEAEDVKDNSNVAQVRRKCSFDMGDILRLSVDVLWLTKPTCYAPQRNWFTNLIPNFG